MQITNPEDFVVVSLRALGGRIGNDDSNDYNDENKNGGGILAAARHWWQWEHAVGGSGSMVAAAAARMQPVGAVSVRQQCSGSAVAAAWRRQRGSSLEAAGSVVAVAVAAMASLTLATARHQLHHQRG